ncbi:hypothetical protein MUK42_35550 [Musa troglodytarum]|uniref:Uncharacterized protein n=1 Tax=Musa troglodytarum TaxID=320322 RepID=A0A9E7GJ08_9LILI|nr:hypothetical protein MUK42_35550 [Musa troglodytarum]
MAIVAYVVFTGTESLIGNVVAKNRTTPCELDRAGLWRIPVQHVNRSKLCAAQESHPSFSLSLCEYPCVSLRRGWRGTQPSICGALCQLNSCITRSLSKHPWRRICFSLGEGGWGGLMRSCCLVGAYRLPMESAGCVSTPSSNE